MSVNGSTHFYGDDCDPPHVDPADVLVSVVAQLDAEHRPFTRIGDTYCAGCSRGPHQVGSMTGVFWPCPTAHITDQLRALIGGAE